MAGSSVGSLDDGPDSTDAVELFEKNDEWKALEAEEMRLAKELEAVRYKIHQHLSTAREVMNQNNPKNLTAQLSTELLHRVFLMSGRVFLPDLNRAGNSGRDNKYKERPNILPFPMLVSHVCRKWRAVSVCNANLWVNLDIWVLQCQPALIELFMERSAGEPLDLHLTYHWASHRRVARLWPPSDDLNAFYWQAQIDNFNYPILLRHVNQWRTLRLTTGKSNDRYSANEGDGYIIKLLDNLNAPNLQSLIIDSVIHHGNFAETIFTGSLPKLHTLHAPGYMAEYTAPMLPPVKHLALQAQSGNFWPVRDALAHFAPALTSFHVNDFPAIQHTRVRPSDPLKFNHLTTFVLQNVQVEDALQYVGHMFVMPALTTLELSRLGDRDRGERPDKGPVPSLDPPVTLIRLSTLKLRDMDGSAVKTIGESIQAPSLEVLELHGIEMTGKVSEVLECPLTPSVVHTLTVSGVKPEFTQALAVSFPHVENLVLGLHPGAVIATLIRAGPIWPSLMNVSVAEIYNYNWVLLTDYINMRNHINLPVQQLLISVDLYQAFPPRAIDMLRDAVEWRFGVDDNPIHRPTAYQDGYSGAYAGGRVSVKLGGGRGLGYGYDSD